MSTVASKGIKVKPLYIAVLVAAVVIILLGVYLATSSVNASSSGVSGPIVANGDMVNVTYTGTFTNGTVFDSNVGKQPLSFTVGAGQVIKGFDNAVLNMSVGQQKQVTIPPNEAYGEVNPKLIVNIPISSFGNQTVEVGMHFSTTSNGQQEEGVVTAVNKTTVTMDFNPALAGQTLIFTIKVLSITKG